MATAGQGNGRRPVIRVRNLSRELRLGKVSVHALRNVNMDIFAGELVSIVGPSGSGKSTLLGLIGGLDSPSSGSVEIDGVDITHMNEDQLTSIRNEKIGFIFQFFNLIPTLTALENVALPIQFAHKPRYRPNERARELLDQLGLADRMSHRPAELSGGQRSPARWPTTRHSCWPMSPPETLTRPPARSCWMPCVTYSGNSAPRSSLSRTTRTWQPTRNAG